jgi:beta-lactamase regulating signal transducer with metallopeptidase domain
MAATLLNHLWQSTLFALAAWALTLVLKHHSARTRYWIWFAVTVKFWVPFSVLTALGLQLRPSSAIGVSFLPGPLLSATLNIVDPVASSRSVDGSLLATMWFVGFAIVLARWWMSWLRARALVSAATPHWMDLDIEVRVSTGFSEPGVFGILQPILLLPSAVVSRLSPAELDAVIRHELCHVRHRDNLTAAVHMFAEAVFWYHPMVWWVGRKLLNERERACDEAVIDLGIAPRTYAEGILNACRLSLESRLGVVAGAGGSGLKHRIEAIIQGRPVRKLRPQGQACLVAIAMSAIVLPLLTGFAAPRPKSESNDLNRPHAIRFDSAWVELTPVNSRSRPRLTLTATQLSMKNTSLRKLISVASGLNERQVIGGPYWLDEHYDIEATSTSTINRGMILTLLMDKYGLRFIERNL